MSAYSIILPDKGQNGILLNSPHSGTNLPERFLKQIAIDPAQLLYSSDLMVDRLIQNTPRFGATVFVNCFARIYVDTNRSAREIDPDMFEIQEKYNNLDKSTPNNFDKSTPNNFDKSTPNNLDKSTKVARGFGIFSRKSFNGQEIYTKKLPVSEIKYRLNHIYHPIHQALSQLLSDLHHHHGFYLLLDCHSMPSYHFIGSGLSSRPQADLIIGNCFGSSCRKIITQHIAEYFTTHGLSVSFNSPYAGGFNTQTYSDPKTDRHALQLEFNRALYMDERTLKANEGFAALQTLLGGLSENLNNVLRHFFPLKH